MRYSVGYKLLIEELVPYLDKCITYWREKRDKENCEYAMYYIDAFQSIRTTFTGEILGEKGGEENEK